ERIGVAATIAQQGELERARLNYRQAAAHFAEAASVVQGADREARFGYLMAQASVLVDHGREFGDNPALAEAIAVYRAILEEYTRERVPLDWAMTQNNLGNALSTLGARESGTASLAAAVDAYRVALEELTRARVPLYWAMTQNNLGVALWTLGERTGRKDQLEAALDAVGKAAEVFLDEAGHTHREAEFEQRIAEIEAAIARLS
ncbi:MAG: tetratricopeptide repeat protein, partial [Rhizobiales bacterium]|nr:tetratricopeptide repeat protein [Hyphomicrobiales bacterium]